MSTLGQCAGFIPFYPQQLIWLSDCASIYPVSTTNMNTKIWSILVDMGLRRAFSTEALSFPRWSRHGSSDLKFQTSEITCWSVNFKWGQIKTNHTTFLGWPSMNLPWIPAILGWTEGHPNKKAKPEDTGPGCQHIQLGRKYSLRSAEKLRCSNPQNRYPGVD